MNFGAAFHSKSKTKSVGTLCTDFHEQFSALKMTHFIRIFSRSFLQLQMFSTHL